jgi:hypothetical protein
VSAAAGVIAWVPDDWSAGAWAGGMRSALYVGCWYAGNARWRTGAMCKTRHRRDAAQHALPN